jgi:hypothetical protein
MPYDCRPAHICSSTLPVTVNPRGFIGRLRSEASPSSTMQPDAARRNPHIPMLWPKYRGII